MSSSATTGSRGRSGSFRSFTEIRITTFAKATVIKKPDRTNRSKHHEAFSFDGGSVRGWTRGHFHRRPGTGTRQASETERRGSGTTGPSNRGWHADGCGGAERSVLRRRGDNGDAD